MGGNSFGETLKQARQERAMSMAELSAESGVSINTIYNWENGKTLPINRVAVDKVSKALNVEIKTLLGENAVSAKETSCFDIINQVRGMFAGGNTDVNLEDAITLKRMIEMICDEYISEKQSRS